MCIRDRPITYHDAVAIQQQGPVVIARNLVDPQRPTWHDPRALRDVYKRQTPDRVAYEKLLR